MKDTNNTGNQKKIIKRLITEEVKNANERLGHINHLLRSCLNRKLTLEQSSFIHYKIWEGVIKTCKKNIKNTHLFHKRYKDEMEKVS